MNVWKLLMIERIYNLMTSLLIYCSRITSDYYNLSSLVTESRLVAFCLSLVSPAWQWFSPFTKSSPVLLPSRNPVLLPLRKILNLQSVVTARMRIEAWKTQRCHIVMVDLLGKSGIRAAWNQRALPSGVVVFWRAVRRTWVRLAIHRPWLSLVQSQLMVKLSLVKTKASRLLHMQPALRRRTFHLQAEL